MAHDASGQHVGEHGGGSAAGAHDIAARIADYQHEQAVVFIAFADAPAAEEFGGELIGSVGFIDVAEGHHHRLGGA